MESAGNPINATRQLPTFSDVDLIPDQFFKYLRNQFLKDFPTTVTDERLLLKNIVDFYKSRGSEKSYRMLFRILFGDDNISFYYPGTDILRASDGRWVVKKSLKFAVIGDADISDVVLVKGRTSGATARKDQFTAYLVNGVLVNELFITHVFGEFKSDEILIDQQTGLPFGRLIGSMVTYDGAWEGTNGFLSSDKKLEDNFYYQEFSYEIHSSVGIAQFQDPVYQLVHPTGTKLFAKLSIDIEFNESQFLQFSFIKSSLDRIQIPIEELLYEYPNISIASVDHSNNYINITALESIGSSQEINVWLDYFAFDDLIGDLPVLTMEKNKFFVSNTPSFIFPTYTTIEIIDDINDSKIWVFAEKIVNTSLLIIDKDYPFGETNNLTYKYRILP